MSKKNDLQTTLIITQKQQKSIFTSLIYLLAVLSFIDLCIIDLSLTNNGNDSTDTIHLLIDKTSASATPLNSGQSSYEKLNHLMSKRHPMPKLRRQSKYATYENLTGILQVSSRFETCTAILLHERMIMTEGICAQPLGFDYLKGKSWYATAKHLKVGHAAHYKNLKAKVIESKVNPRLQLAIHLLDKPLPFAPLTIPKVHSEYQNKAEQKTIATIQSFQTTQFVISRSPKGPMKWVTGRSQGNRFIPFSNDEKQWIKYVQKKLLSHLQSEEKRLSQRTISQL